MLEIMVAILLLTAMSGFIFAGALFFIRHSILGSYGCFTGWDGFYFPGLDAGLFKQLAEAVDSDQLQTVFVWINILIPALAIGGALLFFCAGVISWIVRVLMG